MTKHGHTYDTKQTKADKIRKTMQTKRTKNNDILYKYMCKEISYMDI